MDAAFNDIVLQVMHTNKRKLLNDARVLMSELNYEEELQSLKRRYVPESLVRDDNSAVVLKTKIQESFDSLKEDLELYNHSHQCKVEQSDLQPEKIQVLSDKELFGSLHLLLEHFQTPALYTLANAVTGKAYHCARKVVIKKIHQGLPMLFAQSGQDASECLQKVKNILRNPANISPAYTAVLTEMPSSGLAAAKSTLGQLQKFPIHALKAMNIKMKGKSRVIKLESKETSGKKVVLARRMERRGEKLLKGVQDGDPLPEPLKKALLVASLSARETCGEDGGLLQNLGTISPEVNALHNDFLKAISYVQKLKYLDLKDIYGSLSSDNLSSSKQLCVLQRIIRMFLIDWLFESCDRAVPEPVMRAVNVINKLGVAKESLSERDPISHMTELRLGTELECALNISSHLQQIIYGWTEHAGLDQGIAEMPLDYSEEECEPWFAENSSGTLELDGQDGADVGESFWEPKSLQDQEPGMQEHAKEDFLDGELKNSPQVGILSKNNCHTEDTGREIMEQVQEVCDEASLFAYRLVGCVMDEFLSKQGDALEVPLRAYLRTGLPATEGVTSKSEPCISQPSMEISILLNCAEKLCPQMPISMIEKVKISLGVQ